MPARLALDGIASCSIPFGVSTNVCDVKNVTPRSKVTSLWPEASWITFAEEPSSSDG